VSCVVEFSPVNYIFTIPVEGHCILEGPVSPEFLILKSKLYKNSLTKLSERTKLIGVKIGYAHFKVALENKLIVFYVMWDSLG